MLSFCITSSLLVVAILAVEWRSKKNGHARDLRNMVDNVKTETKQHYGQQRAIERIQIAMLLDSPIKK